MLQRFGCTSFAGLTERTWALFKLFISTLQYFYPISIVLRDFLPALEDNNLSYLFDNKTPLYSRGLKLTYVLNANVGQNLNIYFFAIGETQVSKFMITNEFIP